MKIMSSQQMWPPCKNFENKMHIGKGGSPYAQEGEAVNTKDAHSFISIRVLIAVQKTPTDDV